MAYKVQGVSKPHKPHISVLCKMKAVQCIVHIYILNTVCTVWPARAVCICMTFSVQYCVSGLDEFLSIRK